MTERMQVGELERQYNAAIRELVEVEQTLGEALEYPRYVDDPKNFPDATEADGVCVGEHTPATLATEMAKKFKLLTAQNTDFLIQAMAKGTQLSEFMELFKAHAAVLQTTQELLKAVEKNKYKVERDRNTLEGVNRTLLQHISKLHNKKHDQDFIYEINPDWEKAPDWAMWWAVNANGQAFWHEKQPTIFAIMWEATWTAKYDRMVEIPVGMDWRIVIFQRPEIKK